MDTTQTRMPTLALTFAHSWEAELLAARPPILPRRHYVYPVQVDEVERGALELLVRPQGAEVFLATCALGFASPAVPTGVWSCPHPDSMCAVAGGYAYMVNTRAPEQWIQIPFRPVTEVRALRDADLLLFASFHTLLAWGPEGRVWQSGRLSWEGVRLGEVRDGRLQGWGWDMPTDTEMEFALDLSTGRNTGGPSF
ncbi:MAG: hypothetical protein ACR2JE_17230 [Acidobacteriaceae bacterium]